MECDCAPSHAQTIRFHQFIKEGKLSDEVIGSIMRKEKPNLKEKLHIPYDQIRSYLPRDTSYQQTFDYNRHALEYYQKHHQSA